MRDLSTTDPRPRGPWIGARMSLDLRTLAPTPHQRRLALAWIAAIAALFVAMIPLGPHVAGRLPPFFPMIPAAIAAIFGCALMTAYLLWRQFWLLGRPAIGILGLAYFLNALLPIALVAFYPVPGQAFVPGGAQGGVWLWLVSHGTYPILALVFALIAGRQGGVSRPTALAWIRVLVVGALVFIVTLCLGLVQFADSLPAVVDDATYTPLFKLVAWVEAIVCVAALGVLWIRTRIRNIVQLWLAVSLFAFLATIGMDLIAPSRSSVAHWVGFVEMFISSSVLLFALVHETGRLNEVIADHRLWLTSVVDNVGDALLTFGSSRTITWCNAAAARMFRTTPETIIGLPVASWFPQLDPEDRATRTHESTGRRADGSIFAIEISSSMLVTEGRSTTILIARDITERKRVQEALAGARDQALIAARAKSDFLATMSHEIRTPINAIVGMAELLMETPMSDQQREYGRTVQNSAEALMTIIDDILDVSKLEAGKLQLDLMPFDPLKTVETAADIVAAQARKKSLAVVSFVDPAVPRRVWGDANRLRQILLNLLSNAVKFTDTGRVVVRATLVREENDAAVLRFEVEDTGIGIAAEVQERLFAPFEQADQSTSRRYGGTGLGLSISRRLVALMNGSIGVRSSEGEGSTFWFEARFAKQHDRVERDLTPLELEGMRALIVDDDAMTRSILQQYLRAWRIDAEGVPDAETALVALRAAVRAGRAFDVALIDFRMPGRDGVSLGREIAADSSLAGTRTVLITAYDEVGRGREALASGFSHYLRKPVRQSILFDALSQATRTILPEEPPLLKVTPTESSPDTGGRAKILLVEDHPVNRTLALQQLKRLGFAADVATNGREALEALQRERYSLVIMDCQMPEMDGFEATRRIRRREATSGGHISIVAMTANAMEGDRESCLAAGMDDYLAKPVRLDDLRRVLEQYAGVSTP